jgi:hypothetical protein
MTQNKNEIEIENEGELLKVGDLVCASCHIGMTNLNCDPDPDFDGVGIIVGKSTIRYLHIATYPSVTAKRRKNNRITKKTPDKNEQIYTELPGFMVRWSTGRTGSFPASKLTKIA